MRKYHRQHFLLPGILQQNPLRTEQGESTFYSLSFEKMSIAKYADARKLRDLFAEGILAIGRTDFLCRIENASQIYNYLCKTWRLHGFQINHAKPNQLRRWREIFKTSYTQKKIQDPSIRTVLWHLKKLVKGCIGIMTDLLRTDPKHMELQSERCDE